MSGTKGKSGGVRTGAGKPLKYGEPTVMYYERVPESQKDNVKRLVKSFLKLFEK
jgi:hypothetical protein